MGLSTDALKCFLIARKAGASFKSIITLGRQQFYVKQTEVKAIASTYGQSIGELSFTDQYSEPFYKALGAEHIDSIDYSNYEGATIVHDMNIPIPESLKGKYDCVFDGGTLEHVFNFPQAIKNCMQLVKVGGYFLSVTPSNNQMGHGFYQFSPELFYRVFSEENGFEVLKIFICAHNKNQTFYEVKDPNEVQSRVTLTNNSETNMITIAKRIAVKEIFATAPQQSDYSSTWQSKAEEKIAGPVNPAGIKKLYKKIIPVSLRDKIWRLRYDLRNKKTYSSDLGLFHPDHFKKYQ